MGLPKAEIGGMALASFDHSGTLRPGIIYWPKGK